MIQRGYDRRHRHEWSIARLQTFYTMAAQTGTKNLQEAGIFNPSDLIQFPWEKETGITQSEADDLRAEIDSYNAQNAGPITN